MTMRDKAGHPLHSDSERLELRCRACRPETIEEMARRIVARCGATELSTMTERSIAETALREMRQRCAAKADLFLGGALIAEEIRRIGEGE